MTRVLLVRHGQSEWNASGRWQGQADPPLTDLGRRQAAHAVAGVRQARMDSIVASHLQRAQETAAIINDGLDIGPVATEPNLCERDAGEWTGLTRVQIEEAWPGYLDRPHRRQEATDSSPTPPRRPPRWESDHALLERVTGALSTLYDQAPDGRVLVITHGGVIYAIEQRLNGGFNPMANLMGRWVEIGSGGTLISLGERVTLVDPDEVTIPAGI